MDTFAVEQEGSLLSKGNEVIVPASGETAEDIAVASSVRRSGTIFGGDLNVVTPVSKLDPDYIALAITYSKAHDDLAKRAQGKSVVHVHGNDIAEVEIPYPSESEQKRISTVVLGLDSLITLHQRMCSIFLCVPSSAFARMDQEPISHQSSKDSIEYYATCVPCRRCARCHRRWLQAPLTSPGRLRFRFFLRWRVGRLASARKNSISSLMCCCSGSLSSQLRGSVACVSRVLDGGGEAGPPTVSD